MIAIKTLPQVASSDSKAPDVDPRARSGEVLHMLATRGVSHSNHLDRFPPKQSGPHRATTLAIGLGVPRAFVASQSCTAGEAIKVQYWLGIEGHASGRRSVVGPLVVEAIAR